MKMPKWSFLLSYAVILGISATGARAAGRPEMGPGQNNAVPHPTSAVTQVQPADLNQLLQCLVGPNAVVTNAVLTAAPGAAGTFTGGAGVFGIDQGIVLTSGSINTIVGPNLADDTSWANYLAGDADLDGLIPGYQTFDATVLEFDFQCDQSTVISFQYVFGSEEYNEYVATAFNDVFGFFLNGTNIAVVPASCSQAGIPVAINNVDCENPYNAPNGPNCNCYRNNELSTRVQIIDSELDGMTQVFYAVATIQPGVNHMKLAIADAGDWVLDSAVLIHCQSFTCGAPPAVGACCIEGDDCFLLGQAQCLEQGGIYKGDGVPCAPQNPCEPPVPAIPSTWGDIKARYR